MLYFPEILPVPGVTLAILGRTLGRKIGIAVLLLKEHAPLLMTFLAVLVI